MTDFYAFLALALYLLCSWLLLLRIQGNPLCTRYPVTWLLAPGFAAVLLHALALYHSLITPAGLQFGLSGAASVIGAVISLLVLLMSARRQTILLAAVVLPVTGLSILLERLFPVSHILPPGSASGLKIHVLVSIIAYSLLGLAALISIILAMQNHLLHNHRSGGVLRHLPPLQTTEKLMFDAITAGFLGLTLALASGLVFLDNLFAQHLAHKTVLSIIAWGVFAGLLTGHRLLGWRGRTAIHWTLSGFAFLMLAYFGSKLMLEVILAR
ncbi:MAG: hypothetical protein QG652_906 [Pseudomonadota bacterium]|nr:hypothetical protein [Pseudomonadota bacterium]